MAVTPDGRRAYVMNYASNTVSAIDIATRTVVATIPISAGTLAGIAMAPDGQRLYIAKSSPSSVVIVNLPSHSEDPAFTVGLGDRSQEHRRHA